jgi:hypothetical protein
VPKIRASKIDDDLVWVCERGCERLRLPALFLSFSAVPSMVRQQLSEMDRATRLAVDVSQDNSDDIDDPTLLTRTLSASGRRSVYRQIRQRPQ